MNPPSKIQNPKSKIAALLPRRLSFLAALAAVGLAFGYAFSEETPVGRVRGQALLADTRRPLSRVHVTLTPIATEGETLGIREAVTDSEGRFLLTQVPAGSYQASAYTRRHSVREAYVNVDEGGTTEVTLALERSEADLELGQHQRVFATSEKVFLPVRGYVDGKKPVGRDMLHLRVYRTSLSNVLRDEKAAAAMDKIGDRYGDNIIKRLPAAMLRPAFGSAPRLVSERDDLIKEADREGFFTRRIQFGELGPGLYLVDIFHEKYTECAWLLVTDTALVVKRAGRQMTAYAANMMTGTPFAGTDVRVYRGASLIAQGRTSAEGLAQLNLPPKIEQEERLLTVAARGEDEAVVNREFYGNEEEGRFTVEAYTDRPIYRPGQRIYYKGIARRNVEKGVRYSVPAGEPVTIEIRDPNGDRVLREKQAANSYGSFFGHADLSPESPTGVYSMIMNVRGEKHTHDIVIASYKKPEYKVEVTPGRPRYAAGEPVEMIVSARYYFDAPVAGARVKWEVYRRTDWEAEYPADYEYDEEEGLSHYEAYDEGAYGETSASGEAALDENGRAVIRLPAAVPNTPEAPQAYVFALTATVTDDSGRAVTANGEARVTAGDFRLTLSPDGYVAEPGKPSGVTLMARDWDGRPVPNLSVNVESVYSRWDSKKYRYLYTPAGAPQKVTTGPDGKAAVTITPPRAGELRVNARAADAKGRVIRARTYLWAAGDEGGALETEYADLSVLTDRRRYNPGDTARVLINAQRTGQTALLTVEGDRVYRAFTIPMTKKSVIVRVPVMPEYGPNVILSACYVRDKHFARSEAPLRVTMARKEIRVTIRADRETRGTPNAQRPTPNALPRYLPGEKITYTVQTADAKGRPAPCELSFGVVDESIYALREDDPTALSDAFYPRRYNQVQTHYSFAVEYLGDADKAEPQIVARKRFPDTAYWNPALRTDAQGRAVVRFALPDSLTTWRATAVAQTLDTALGRETDRVVVSKDFFVRVEKPRFLTQNDRSRLLVLVHNETGAPQTALVRLRAEGLTAEGDMTQTLSLRPGQVGQAVWPVTAGPMGEAKLRVTAWTPKRGTAPQYTDGIETTLPVLPHGRELTPVLYAGEVTTGQEPEVLRLDPAAIPGASRLTIRITPSVTCALGSALEYLVGYPYGCTEQTMSRFLPDVLAHRVQKLTPPTPPSQGGARGGILTSAQVSGLPQMVRDSLARLYRFQHQKGGWGWWEQDADDPWMTAYVLYGLSEAQADGYPVSRNALARGRKAAAEMLATVQDDNTKAFLLYALALAGDRTTPRAARNSLRLGALSSEALAHVVLLDKLLGESAREAMDLLDRKAVSEGGMLHWKSGRANIWDWNDRLATAAALRAMLAINRRDPRIPAVLRWLMANRTGEYWESTRDTSWVVAALCDYLAGKPQEAAPTGEVRILLNGQAFRSYTLTPDLIREPEIVLRLPATALRPGKNTVLLERTGGSSTVFYSVELRQKVAMEDMPAVSPYKIGIKREYLRVLPKKIGQDSWTLQTEPTGNRLRQGDRIRVRLTLTVPQDMAYVLIEDPFPSGCEVTERGTAEETELWGFWYSSVDVRDDRIAFFARTLTKGEHVIEYNLRAQTPGSYHALPTLLQGMYIPETRGESAEARVEVR
jgi:uncharacterized protein YfaS (alpha-2-macroglobulin family)/5-hydroxyisourate hydrolase-like protein (transthyretin family)